MTCYALFSKPFESHEKSFDGMHRPFCYDSADTNKVYFVSVENLEKHMCDWNNQYITEVAVNDFSNIHQYNKVICLNYYNAFLWTELSNVTYGKTYNLDEIQTHKMLIDQGHRNLLVSIHKIAHRDHCEWFCDKLRKYSNYNYHYDNPYTYDGVVRMLEYLSETGQLNIIQMITELIKYAHEKNPDCEEFNLTLSRNKVTNYIQIAIRKSHCDIVKYFMDLEFDANTCLMTACQSGNLGLVQDLITKEAVPDEEMLKVAAHEGYFDIAKILIENGVDLHTDNEYVLSQAVNKRNLDMVGYLAAKGADLHVDAEAPLRLAASKGDLPLVKYFVEQGANIHARDDDAFKKAFLKVHTEVLTYLKSVDTRPRKQRIHLP